MEARNCLVPESGAARHPSDDVVKAFEQALRAHGADLRQETASIAVRNVGRALGRARLLGHVSRPGDRPVALVPMMGAREHRLLPLTYTHRLALYCWDVWPPAYQRWEDLFRRHRVALACFTARQSADYFRDRIAGMAVAWTPEATAPKSYDARLPLTERPLHVLELGRRWQHWHELVVDRLHSAGYDHRYEFGPGQVIFPRPEDLVHALGQTLVSICFPASRTHPSRAGAVSTMTHRYLESMASGCLLMGEAPQELVDLFGYDPVIPVDVERAADQVMEVLQDPAAFQCLVDHNRSRLDEVATWTVRAREVLSLVSSLADGAGSADTR